MFRNKTFNILSFLLIFAALYYSFVAYIGVISPGGKSYSPFLDKYANFPAWLTYFICQCAKGALQLMGYDVYQKAANNVTIRGTHGVNIIWACLGFGVMSFWMAFVVAHKAAWKYKLKWVTIGIGLITGINILRIASIALGNHNGWKRYTSIEPHFAFNVASYAAIIGLAIWFVRVYNRNNNRKSNASNPLAKGIFTKE